MFFITINCRPRQRNQLCRTAAASVIFEAAEHYVKHGKWHPRLLMLMPDHLHMITVFDLRENRMRNVVESWKGWVGKKAGVKWQRGFFDHRLRNDKEIREKTAYILLNPVRAELVHAAKAWTWKRTPPW